MLRFGTSLCRVALRKESVDRNFASCRYVRRLEVALRKESVDRNVSFHNSIRRCLMVALRKESVDRNSMSPIDVMAVSASLSARRAWIEIMGLDGRFKL